ncbi:MAG: hypothetical protein WC915_01910 [archaeon]|jgi:hypothetical protein
MAKPIRATPTLTGKDAIRFLDQMKRNNDSDPSKIDKKLINLLKENKSLFSQIS